ncbi:hypothetical protein [Streptomyces sp. Isolate_219]|uniref:hypothetical protein n=1 Tax=Streptomyces sp. Isolate_219 TaxID=2950110 RepID=UPI0021C9AA77|nr:hypothetical protein [Streptomyces sp. Isolate_219]MCR8574715.1 hypothetical protein [Streptomyces sp. Isolate_219]
MTDSSPTADDIARAIAELLPRVPAKDLILQLKTRPQAESRHGSASWGAPLQTVAEHIHATLYGLSGVPASTLACGCRRDQGCTCPFPITEETDRA